MTTVIAVPVLAEADAIGADVLGMEACLTAQGCAVHLAAEKSLVNRDVLPLADLLRWPRRDDLLIYHHSLGNDVGTRVARSWPGRVVVKYHNVTPARYFTGSLARAAADGVRQAAELAACTHFWSDSAFNLRELGLPGGTVLPPFMPTESLCGIAPDPDYSARLCGWPTTLLSVGRLAPNKNIMLALDTLATYRRLYDGQARLLLAGRHVNLEYSEAIRERIEHLGLAGSVAVTGRVDAAQLKALYLAADALLVTSDHEGFCVPLVEAMALAVPTVAVPHAAIPETAGEFARYAAAEPLALAAAVNELVQHPARRARLLLDGRRRYSTLFTPSVISSRFLQLLDSLEKR